MYSPGMGHSSRLCHCYSGNKSKCLYTHILTPHSLSFAPKCFACTVHVCVKFILWLSVSSHRSFSLPCQLICLLAVIPSLLSITDMPSRHRDIHAACLQQGHKEPRCINIPISALSVVLQTTHWQREKHLIAGCIIVLLANSSVLSGSKGLFIFLVYLRQQQRNKLITEMCSGVQCRYAYVYVYLYACM